MPENPHIVLHMTPKVFVLWPILAALVSTQLLGDQLPLLKDDDRACRLLVELGRNWIKILDERSIISEFYSGDKMLQPWGLHITDYDIKIMKVAPDKTHVSSTPLNMKMIRYRTPDETRRTSNEKEGVVLSTCSFHDQSISSSKASFMYYQLADVV